MSSLNGKNILITAGSTRGYLDAVRYITNTSTGKLSCEIALEALHHGASVTYIHGKNSVLPVVQHCNDLKADLLDLIEIETNADLESVLQVMLRQRNFDAVIHAMAVSDYVPEKTQLNKISSKKEEWMIKLVRTPKVIKIIRRMWPETYLVGFKLEVNKKKDELVNIARDFLKESKADLVVVNDSQDISDKRHVAYFVSHNFYLSDQFRNKKEIAEGLILHLEQLFK